MKRILLIILRTSVTVALYSFAAGVSQLGMVQFLEVAALIIIGSEVHNLKIKK